MTLQAELRQIIDDVEGQGDIAPVCDFIADHPDLDLDVITPNGLSALWWALTPPLGKTINHELVAYLSIHTNVVQTYLGDTPRDYLQLLQQTEEHDYKVLINWIKIIEDQHVVQRPQQFNHQQGELAHIAADDQNVHDTKIVSDTDHSVVRLYQRYGAALDTAGTLKEIRAHLPGRIGRFLFSGNNVEDAVNAVEADVSTRCYTLDNGETVTLTISDLLCLVWHAAHEQNAELLCGSTASEADVTDRREAIYKALREGKGYCWTGRSGRIVHSLNSRHEDVRHDIKELDDEQSYYKYTAMMGQELSALLQSDTKRFWHLIQIGLLGEDALEENKQVYRAFVSELIDKRDFVTALKMELLNDKAIEQFRDRLKHYELPIAGCPPLKGLVPLQNLYAIAKRDEEFNQQIKTASSIEPQKLIASLIEQYPLHVIERKVSGTLSGYLKDYFEKLNDTQKEEVYRDIVSHHVDVSGAPSIDWEPAIYRAAMSNYLAHHHPSFLAWYQGLSMEMQSALIGKEPPSGESILKFALTNGCLKKLDLKTFDLSQVDLRGVDLSDMNLTDVTLSTADLRLVTYNEKSMLGKANLTEVMCSPNLLHSVLYRLQDRIARGQQINESDVDLANSLLRDDPGNLKTKDQHGVDVLQIILGQNKYYVTLNREKDLFIYLPPIQTLLDHPVAVKRTTEIDRAVNLASIRRYKIAGILAIVAAMALTLGLIVVGAAGMSISTAASGTTAAMLAIYAAGMIAVFLGVYLGSSAVSAGLKIYQEAVKAEHSGIKNLSTYHHPFVVTSKNIVRLKGMWSGMKEIFGTIVSPFIYIGGRLKNLFVQESGSDSRSSFEALPLPGQDNPSSPSVMQHKLGIPAQGSKEESVEHVAGDFSGQLLSPTQQSEKDSLNVVPRMGMS